MRKKSSNRALHTRLHLDATKLSSLMAWYADRAHASGSGDVAQSQGVVDELDRGGAAVAYRTV